VDVPLDWGDDIALGIAAVPMVYVGSFVAAIALGDLLGMIT
jgi:hypothetical protein